LKLHEKVLRDNAPLQYPNLIIAFMDQFDKPFVKNKRTFKIGSKVINSFGFDKNIDGHCVHKRSPSAYS